MREISRAGGKGFFAAILLGASLAAGAAEEVWTGDRVVDTTVEVRGKSLRIAPGARVAFKGEGRLVVVDGGLTASRAVFAARTTMTNRYRIVVQNGRIDLADCRFSGLKAFKPDPEHANFMRGFLRNQYGSGSRVVRCTFADCSALMILNASHVEVSRNLAVGCDNAFSFLNCTECRLEFNEFFNAPCGFTLSGTRLSECFHNRFTDCAIGADLYYCTENRCFANAFFGCGTGLKLWGGNAKSVFMANRFEKVRYPYAKYGELDATAVVRDSCGKEKAK